MTIESKDLLVAIKAFSRGEKLPLDASEIHDSLEQAQTYAQSPTAYAGQTIKVLQNGKYETYVLNPSGDSLALEKVGVDASAVKNYVQIVENLQKQGKSKVLSIFKAQLVLFGMALISKQFLQTYSL